MKKSESTNVRFGIDVVIQNLSKYFEKGERLGVISNNTSQNMEGETTPALLKKQNFVSLKAIFAGEHGFSCNLPAGEKFEDSFDDTLQVPIYSLYGKVRKLQPYQLENIDTLVYDYQDVGVRYYTYIANLYHTIEQAEQLGFRLVVLDRPNPLGCRLFGNMGSEDFLSFVGPFPMLTGMGATIGEIALYIQGVYFPNANLKVVPIENYSPEVRYSETSYNWVSPSPNLKSLSSVEHYPFTCFLEGTELSEGRGTEKPFHYFGAPWFKNRDFIEHITAKKLEGVSFQATTFTPTTSKHKEELCQGVELIITDYSKTDITQASFEILHSLRCIHKERNLWIPPFYEGKPHFIDLLTGGEDIRTGLDKGLSYSDFKERWENDKKLWIEKLKPYKMYGFSSY